MLLHVCLLLVVAIASASTLEKKTYSGSIWIESPASASCPGANFAFECVNSLQTCVARDVPEECDAIWVSFAARAVRPFAVKLHFGHLLAWSALETPPNYWGLCHVVGRSSDECATLRAKGSESRLRVLCDALILLKQSLGQTAIQRDEHSSAAELRATEERRAAARAAVEATAPTWKRDCLHTFHD